MRRKLTGLLAAAALAMTLGALGGCSAPVGEAVSLPETGPEAPASQEAQDGASGQEAQDDALEQAAREEAEALAAAEAAEREAEEKAAAEAKADEEAAAAEAAAQQEVQQQEKKQEGSVYVAASGKGKKYHSNPNCSSMNGTKELSESEAEKQGYTPCKKCY